MIEVIGYMYKKISLFMLLGVGYYTPCFAFPSLAVLGGIATRAISRMIKPHNSPSMSPVSKIVVTQCGLGLATYGLYNFIQSQMTHAQIHPYTVNLMWINRSYNPHQKYVIGSRWDNVINEKPELWKRFNEEALLPVFQWAQVTSLQAEVVLWYDSNHLSLQSIINTQLAIEEHARNHRSHAPIKLKDVRTLEHVKKNPSIFSSECPVFFRADLLRVIATIETLEKGKTRHFVYSDLDIKKPLSREKLFTPEVRRDLKKYGIILGAHTSSNPQSQANPNDYYENQFHIASKDDREALHAIKHSIIDLSIARAYDRKDSSRKKFLGESVYSAYRYMFRYLYSLKGWGSLINTKTQQPYDISRDGLEPFGIKENNFITLDFKSNDTNPDLSKTPWYPLSFEPRFPGNFGGYHD